MTLLHLQLLSSSESSVSNTRLYSSLSFDSTPLTAPDVSPLILFEISTNHMPRGQDRSNYSCRCYWFSNMLTPASSSAPWYHDCSILLLSSSYLSQRLLQIIYVEVTSFSVLSTIFETRKDKLDITPLLSSKCYLRLSELACGLSICATRYTREVLVSTRL